MSGRRYAEVTPAIAAAARALRETDAPFWSYARLAREFGVCEQTLYLRLCPAKRVKSAAALRQAARRRGALQVEAAALKRAAELPRDRVPAATLKARFAEIPHDTRDLTGRLLGDPLPGRSALDRTERGDAR